MATITVRALTRDRKVILSEADPSHPTDNHEIWIVGYEEPRFDADGKEISPANPSIEVGDTPAVRRCLAEGTLEIVSSPTARQQAAPASTSDKK